MNSGTLLTFDSYLGEVTAKTEKLFAVLFIFQWIAGILMAIFISPRIWNGTESQIHIHVYAAIFLGAALTAFPWAMIYFYPGRAATRQVIAISQLLFSALLITLSGGRIETHFHIFGSLAFLAFFRDWRVILTGTIVIVVDHLLRGFYWPASVYGVLTVTPWRTVEHATWIIFEDIVLLYSIRIALREAGRAVGTQPKNHA